VQAERHAEIVDWVGRLGAARAEHIMARFRIGRSWAYARLDRLAADGLLEQRQPLHRQPRARRRPIVVTRPGPARRAV
jgi:DeoR/GlpR family transcriptional regulator of sugar metabolism